jgi:ketosteroid isomerase-like protein
VARSASRVDEVSRWLTALGDGWESGDADAVASLFAVGATMQATPFDELIRGKRAIRDHFADEFQGWPGASFAAQVLGAGDTYGVAHWRVTSGSRARDGVLVAALDGRGRCTSLRQWWHQTG